MFEKSENILYHNYSGVLLATTAPAEIAFVAKGLKLK